MTQISDISRSSGNAADEESFQSKISTMLLSRSTITSTSTSVSSSCFSSEEVTELHADVEARDGNAPSDVSNTMDSVKIKSAGRAWKVCCILLHSTTLRSTALHYATLQSR